MRTLRRLVRVVAVLAAAALAVGGAVAAVQEEWPLAAAAGLLLVFLTFGLLLHLHRKVGNAARSSSRERQRTLTRLQTQLGDVPARLSATVTEALADESAAISGRLLQHLERLAADVAEVDQRVARVHDITARTDVRSDELRSSIEELEASIEQFRSALRREEAAAAGQEEKLAGRLAKIDTRLLNVEKALYRLTYEPVKELDAMHQVRERIPVKGRRPTVWGWALSPRALLQLVDLVERHRPRLVVECGSGLSSIYLGTMLRDVDGARVIALEHEAGYAAETRDYLVEQGLDDVVEVWDAPLRSVEIRGTEYSWYDYAQLEGIQDVDFLLVDGPPERTGDDARYPAVPLLAERLAPGAVVILDDTHRADEAAIVNRWLEEYPLLQAAMSSSPNQSVLRWDADGAGITAAPETHQA